MKNKIMFGLVVAAIASVAALNVLFASGPKNALPAFGSVHPEALAMSDDDDDGKDDKGGCDYTICYWESKVRTGYTYYACGDCLTKVYDEQGKGKKTKCYH